MEKHRTRLVADAEEETQQARDRYLAAIEEAERAREDLIGLRETSIWARLFRSDALQSFAPSHELVGGRRQRTERNLPGMKSGLPAHGVMGLLRDDAQHFATVSTVEQAARWRTSRPGR